MRLKREKEAERQKEEERMEVERRRAMPEEQRLKEDLEHAKKLREAKPQGGGAFLQKYWHKGAFYQACQSTLVISFNNATLRRLTSSKIVIIQNLRNLKSIYHCYQKLCKSKILVNAVGRSTRT